MELKKVVYVITNKINGKKYVGSTGRPAAYRFQEHISDLRSNHHCNKDMQDDFNKFGELAFTFEMVDYVTKSGAESEEYEWMRRLRTFDSRNGYNNRDGAMRNIISELEEADPTKQYDVEKVIEIYDALSENNALHQLFLIAKECDAENIRFVADILQKLK